jgi:rod shape determining protein RodA
MAVGLLPVTGLPLPFLSYGGSFMLSCFAMIGLSVSIGIRREIREQTMWAT